MHKRCQCYVATLIDPQAILLLAPNALIYYTQYVLMYAQGAGVILTVGFTYDIRDEIKWAGGRATGFSTSGCIWIYRFF